MELRRRTSLVYGLLLVVWGIVVAWQLEEHREVRESAKTDLRRSCKAIANTVGAFIRGLQFRGAVFPERLEPAFNELVNGSTNELVKSSELVSIALLNAAGDRLASAGRQLDLSQVDILQQGEHWGTHSVVMVYPVEGATNSSTVVLPPFRELTNTFPEGFRGRFPRRGEPRPEAATNGPPPGDGPPEPP
ncbi:MAG TPA: hypothetical protein VFD66_14445, partial [Verrucomicrobiae bacterium]|nr:hypothetical protein [Verrucomicrobiae bacterium]